MPRAYNKLKPAFAEGYAAFPSTILDDTHNMTLAPGCFRNEESKKTFTASWEFSGASHGVCESVKLSPTEAARIARQYQADVPADLIAAPE